MTVSETVTMTLSEFLLARITEDERWARTNDDGGVGNGTWPKWVLAECEAKRQIVELHSGTDFQAHPVRHLCVDSMLTADACETLRALAIHYADHPDYRDEWKP